MLGAQYGTGGWFNPNKGSAFAGLLFSLLAVALILVVMHLTGYTDPLNGPQKNVNILSYAAAFIWLAAGGIFAYLGIAFATDNEGNVRCPQDVSSIVFLVFWSIFTISPLALGFYLLAHMSYTVLVLVIGTTVLAIVTARKCSVYTPKGRSLTESILGVKRYLLAPDAVPSAEQWTTLLPYALAWRIEQEWIGCYADAHNRTLPPLDWIKSDMPATPEALVQILCGLDAAIDDSYWDHSAW